MQTFGLQLVLLLDFARSGTPRVLSPRNVERVLSFFLGSFLFMCRNQNTGYYVKRFYTFLPSKADRREVLAEDASARKAITYPTA